MIYCGYVLYYTLPYTLLYCIIQGMTALHFAADRGYNEIVEFLVQNGASINTIDSSGQTALMYAASCENKVGLLVLW